MLSPVALKKKITIKIDSVPSFGSYNIFQTKTDAMHSRTILFKQLGVVICFVFEVLRSPL